MAFTTDYILDGILALSALHIARYNSSRKHILLPYAIERHSLSLSKALPLIPVVTPQNSPSLFVFGMLALLFNLARPIENKDVSAFSNGVIPEWLYLMHGVDTVVMADRSILSSPVCLIFKTTWGSRDYWMSHSPEKYQVLVELEDRICDFEEGEEKKRTLQNTIAALSRSYSFLYGRDFKDQDKLRGFYIWLYEVDNSFFDLVKNGDNGALCVLAFYAVLIKDLEKYWWMEGWAVHLIRGIYMLLDGEHRIWIRWAIEEIGWVPDASLLLW
ncbi:hypothetical protein N7478_008782 [Penicillium angulare]|uniref:uncharacterized protein n=1 Tax=Penicillium angulare TaxID=116970 RepID=UPI002540D75B|nr:uncharacterized protein N7478_008782 [Penicillium angulare]KAJ5273657.1 hypothetical protein N7478_008782 [Penicillium angulare]